MLGEGAQSEGEKDAGQFRDDAGMTRHLDQPGPRPPTGLRVCASVSLAQAWGCELGAQANTPPFILHSPGGEWWGSVAG